MDMSSIFVRQGQHCRGIVPLSGETLLDVLRRGGYFLDAPCGGQGRCGKCRVQIDGPAGEKEVLACRTPASAVRSVILPEEAREESAHSSVAAAPGQRIGAAVDLGTTTVEAALLSLPEGRVLARCQRRSALAPYGGDVLSRIAYIDRRPPALALLSRLSRRQVQDMLESLLSQCALQWPQVETVSLAGNTVMQHIFRGLSPSSIGRAPFVPLSLFTEEEGDRLAGRPLLYAPCVAGYVGGDITAGLAASGLADRPGQHLFLDVGTNGEMALGGRDGFLCCAVACGPAFEGAGITCGMTYGPGAVCHARAEGGRLLIETAPPGPARGICGAGLLELTAALLALEVVDAAGRLLPPEEAPAVPGLRLERDADGNGVVYLTEDRSVYLTAADVRQVQLAKGAVAAGVQVLLLRAGLRAEEVDSLTLAGQLGAHLSLPAAAALGMLPRCLTERGQSVGNAALRGAALFLTDLSARNRAEAIRRSCRYIELSGDGDFSRLFPEQLLFSQEPLL